MRLAAVLWLSFDVKFLVGIKFQGPFCGLRVNTFFDVCDLHAMKLYDYELYFACYFLTFSSDCRFNFFQNFPFLLSQAKSLSAFANKAQ